MAGVSMPALAEQIHNRDRRSLVPPAPLPVLRESTVIVEGGGDSQAHLSKRLPVSLGDPHSKLEAIAIPARPNYYTRWTTIVQLIALTKITLTSI
ncbi:hypothetical protein RSOLAG1IB_10525 [Rhizoctonia solani AG-1 IB]|uniref:Uncharacterized protein n=1 Tax=Thanatephorus cucumeris (strain AG1-IB / isolate 7/3/14) TaxID=1108050 RepID=A0A0B7G171_THACB|nr:hypothetical protein RSOLAG1IB_10525 [Rhizoctonia solani AG-1 IB]